MEQKTYTATEMFSISPIDLNNYLIANFRIEVPTTISTKEDLEKASKLLSQAYAYYSFFTSMKLSAGLQKRALRVQKENKDEIDKMIDREKIFDAYAGIARQAYDTVSRMITIKQQINQEMKMI